MSTSKGGRVSQKISFANHSIFWRYLRNERAFPSLPRGRGELGNITTIIFPYSTLLHDLHDRTFSFSIIQRASIMHHRPFISQHISWFGGWCPGFRRLQANSAWLWWFGAHGYGDTNCLHCFYKSYLPASIPPKPFYLRLADLWIEPRLTTNWRLHGGVSQELCLLLVIILHLGGWREHKNIYTMDQTATSRSAVATVTISAWCDSFFAAWWWLCGELPDTLDSGSTDQRASLVSYISELLAAEMDPP